jgi:hypothetical protein
MSWVKEVTALRASQDPPNVRLAAIVDVLKAHGKATELLLTPDKVAPHPKNRGGRMVLASDCHKNGKDILGGGAKFSRIGESIAFEMPQCPAKSGQYTAMLQHLIHTSQGMLAPLSGAEVGLTVGSTNTAAFCRASMANCTTNQPGLANPNGRLHSPDSYGGDFGAMCSKGWQWLLISRDVEQHFPDLPGWMSHCLNNTNVAMKPKEIETAKSLAKLMQQGTSQEAAVEEVKESHPDCESYIDAVALYAHNFGGGQGSPLLTCLDDYVKILCCTSCVLGEEFMTALVALKPKSLSTTFPFVRLACWLAQATSPKVTDGISKLLTVSDISKLRTAKVADIEAIELLLSQGWDLGPASHQDAIGHFDPDVVQAFGKFATRAIVHFLQKEKNSLEPDGFKSLSLINELYQAQFQTNNGASSSATPKLASPVASLADCKDVGEIVLSKFAHLKLNSFYGHKDHGQFVFEFIKINDTVAVFECTPLFGKVITVEAPHSELRMWRKLSSAVPALIPNSTYQAILPSKSKTWAAEAKKAQVFLCLCKVYEANSLEDDLEFAKDPAAVFLKENAETYKKGELVLVPVGTLKTVVDLTDALKLPADRLITQDGKAVYSINPQSKNCLTKADIIVPASWVTTSKDKAVINMEIKYVVEGGFKFPMLQNSRAVRAREQLFMEDASKPKAEGPASKKLKADKSV